MENKTMMTDFYELTMAQTYFDKGEQNKKVYFDVFLEKIHLKVDMPLWVDLII